MHVAHSSQKYAQVLVRRRNEGFDLSRQGDTISFDDMRSRRVPADPDMIHERVRGNGHVCANLGISVALTIDYYRNHFVMLVPHVRKDRGDEVAKFISGYLEWDRMSEPLDVALEEVGEEFVPLTRDGLIIQGFCNGKKLPSNGLGISYDTQLRFEMFSYCFAANPYNPLGMDNAAVSFEGHALPGSPQLYIHAPTNSAQLLYHFHVSFPQIPGFRYAKVQSTLETYKNLECLERLACAEHVFDDGELKSTLSDRCAILVRMRGNDITHEVYEFRDSDIRRIPNDITLYEAFCPKRDNVVAMRNISLHDYLTLPR